MSDLYKLQDPTKQYPQPKFKYEPQAVPGLDAEMAPKADHGEKSDKGSGRCPDKKIPDFGSETPVKRRGQPVEMLHCTSCCHRRSRAT